MVPTFFIREKNRANLFLFLSSSICHAPEKCQATHATQTAVVEMLSAASVCLPPPPSSLMNINMYDACFKSRERGGVRTMAAKEVIKTGPTFLGPPPPSPLPQRGSTVHHAL